MKNWIDELTFSANAKKELKKIHAPKGLVGEIKSVSKKSLGMKILGLVFRFFLATWTPVVFAAMVLAASFVGWLKFEETSNVLGNFGLLFYCGAALSYIGSGFLFHRVVLGGIRAELLESREFVLEVGESGFVQFLTAGLWVLACFFVGITGALKGVFLGVLILGVLVYQAAEKRRAKKLINEHFRGVRSI